MQLSALITKLELPRTITQGRVGSSLVHLGSVFEEEGLSLIVLTPE
jgi:hypothetical protein